MAKENWILNLGDTQLNGRTIFASITTYKDLIFRIYKVLKRSITTKIIKYKQNGRLIEQRLF